MSAVPECTLQTRLPGALNQHLFVLGAFFRPCVRSDYQVHFISVNVFLADPGADATAHLQCGALGRINCV